QRARGRGRTHHCIGHIGCRRSRSMSAPVSMHDSQDVLIRLERIGKTYCAGEIQVRALSNVSLCVHRGEFVAIIGQSGSGKTTLLDIIGLLSRPTEGEYWLEGRPVSAFSDSELAGIRNRTIGFVFQ